MAPSANAFEAGERKVIPAVLVYLFCRGQVLMIHKGEGTGDSYHQGKWNGLGGKCEADESPLEAELREVREEGGISVPGEALAPLGTLQFPNFKAHKKEDWLVFVFTGEISDDLSARVIRSCDEGTLHWVPQGDLPQLNLWEGDELFIPYVQAREPFMGTIWYDGPRVARHWMAGCRYLKLLRA